MKLLLLRPVLLAACAGAAVSLYVEPAQPPAASARLALSRRGAVAMVEGGLETPPETADSSVPRRSEAPRPRDNLPLTEPCNVVLTHTNADFDSLAGAVSSAAEGT